MSSAEAIASVVDDLRSHRATRVGTDERARLLGLAGVVDPVVIDATAIHQTIRDSDKLIAIYEDHPCIPPPFDEFVVAFENSFGNVLAVHCSLEPDEEQWETHDVVDWDRVRWRLRCFLWLGGSSPVKGPMPTRGPVWLWQIAIYDDGEPADIHWVDMAGLETDWDMAMVALLGSLNFLACRNVELVEPQRPRAERRRLARIGDGTISVKTISVFPIGRSGRGGEPTGVGVPLTTVRGHMAHYGEAWGKGLLFGKYEGRFWVPSYARGSREHGETRNSYALSEKGQITHPDK